MSHDKVFAFFMQIYDKYSWSYILVRDILNGKTNLNFILHMHKSLWEQGKCIMIDF